MTLDEARSVALGLPETAEAPHFHYTSFRVAGKIFLTAPPEGTHLHCFVDEPTRELALAAVPECCEALWWGERVAGLRVALSDAPDQELRHWIHSAWRHKAPKRLLKQAQGG